MAMTEQQNMMRRLQVQSFAIDDIKLFLDTHPDDRQAMEYYQKYRHLRQQTMNNYVKQFGPVTPDQVEGTDRWTWIDTPWPWEGTV